MKNKTLQQSLKFFFALALMVGLLVPASPTSALPHNAPLYTDITPVEPNDVQYKHASPTIPPTDQWHFHGAYGINAPMAWGITTGSTSTVVAVLDTGITDHEDFTESRILNNPGGYDFISDVSNAYDLGDYTGCPAVAWRGTHVAGIIGAASDNTIGVAGINWNAEILPVRVSGDCGITTAADIVDGMRWAAGLITSPENENPANVIHVSASISGQACTDTYQTAVNDVLAQGAVIVAAAGDGNTSTVGFPANCNGVITVAATDASGNRADYSNNGAAVEISAPGGGNGQGDVLSTSQQAGVDAYLGMTGTAMAAAHVSGVVSLMFAANPRITPAQVSAILQKTATDRGFPSGSDCSTSTCGWGIVDAYEAVRVANMPDLVITNATLTDFSGVPFNTPYLGQEFQVNVTVKNQGGLNLHELNGNSVTLRQVYVDRDPSSIARDELGCVGRPLGGDDLGEFGRFENNSAIASGAEATLAVKINNTSDPEESNRNPWPDPLTSSEYYDGSTQERTLEWEDGTHTLYVYVDANCGVDESDEDNNAYSTSLTINPFAEGALLYPKHGQNIGTDYNPTYKWNKVTGATRYHLYLSGPTGVLLDQWFEAVSVCDTVTPTCSVELGPNLTLGNGNYSWYMQPYSPSSGNGPWSNNSQPTTFTTVPLPPPAVDLTDPLTFPPHNEDLGTNYTTTFTWKKVSTATYYNLYVVGPGGAKLLDQWYQASSICNDTTCSVASPALGAGSHAWYVRTYNPGGYGPWSNTDANGVVQPTNFTTLAALPGAVQTASMWPNVNIGTNYTPTYTWEKVVGATWYRLYVSGPGGAKVLDQWYQASSICDDTTCSVASPLLGGGTYGWLIQTYNPAGYGPWSNNTNSIYFSTSTTPPGAAVNLSPNSDIGVNYTPDYTWNKVAGATWYRLKVVKIATGGVVVDTWYQASSICPDTTCSVASPMLGGGQYGWYVQTYGPGGYGPWSNNASPTYFNTTATPPPAVSAASMWPNTYIGAAYTPTYTWGKVVGATWYHLYVSGPAGVVVDKWYESANICNNDTCFVESPLLGGGQYGWSVQTYGVTGYGPWTTNIIFSTSTTPPGVVDTASMWPDEDIGTNYTPTYTWEKVAAATYYRLYVSGPGGAKVLDQWYQASSICPDTTCSVISPLLGGGTYGWYVQTYNPAGYGPWTNNGQIPIYFNTATVVPEAAVLTDPVDGQNLGKEYNPIYRWSKVDGATYYHVYVGGPTGVVLDQWYPASTVCDLVGCSTVSPTLAGGAYVWYVQTYGPGGYGPWSNGMNPTHFTADIPTLPMAATDLSPTGTISNTTPTFSWRKVSMAIWYRLYIKGPTGVVRDQWYQSVSICSGDVCSVQGPVLANGDYTWWVQTYSSAGYGPWKSSAFKVYP